MAKEEQHVHEVSKDSRTSWLQLAVGMSVTLVFGLIAYIVNLLNEQIGDTIVILQAADKVVIERLVELEKQSSYVLARRAENNRRFESIEKEQQLLRQQMNELRARR